MYGPKPARQYPITEKMIRSRRRWERIERVVDVVRIIIAVVWFICVIYTSYLISNVLVKFILANQ